MNNITGSIIFLVTCVLAIFYRIVTNKETSIVIMVIIAIGICYSFVRIAKHLMTKKEI